MIFPELDNPEVSIYLEPGEDGLRCNRNATPDDVLKLFKEINKDYSEVMGMPFISFYDGDEEPTEVK